MHAKEALSQKLMKEPSIEELSMYLEIDETTINDIILSHAKMTSLDETITEDDKSFELYDKFGYLDPSIENYPLSYELSKLTPLEQKIIIARYYNNMSQQELGKALGMYQVEVSRQEKKILEKLRSNLVA